MMSIVQTEQARIELYDQFQQYYPGDAATGLNYSKPSIIRTSA